MPIYEYLCSDCQHRFELLVHGPTTLECPRCRSRRVAKQLSVFAVGAASSAAQTEQTPCPSCGDPRGAGACRLD